MSGGASIVLLVALLLVVGKPCLWRYTVRCLLLLSWQLLVVLCALGLAILLWEMLLREAIWVLLGVRICGHLSCELLRIELLVHLLHHLLLLLRLLLRCLLTFGCPIG